MPGDQPTIQACIDCFKASSEIADNIRSANADEFRTHLYYLEQAAPGKGINLKVIGPPQQPVLLCWSGALLDPPKNTRYGLWHLMPPLVDGEDH